MSRTSEPPDNIVRLDQARTDRLLKDLAANPFIAVVLENGKPHAVVYTKGIELSPDTVRIIKATLDDVTT